MKAIKNEKFKVGLAVVLLIVLTAPLAWSQNLHTLSFRGIVRDDDGRAISDGDYNLTFRIYNVDRFGTALWTETHTGVQVRNSAYAVVLGEITSLANLDFNEAYWVGVTPEGGVEQEPRTTLSATPYALNVIKDDWNHYLNSLNIADVHNGNRFSISFSKGGDATGIEKPYVAFNYEGEQPDGIYGSAENLYFFADDTYTAVAHIAPDGNWFAHSDRRLKMNIEPLAPVIDKVMKLRPVRFHYLDSSPDQPKSIGLIAQEVEPLFPALISQKDNGFKFLNYRQLGTIAIAAVQEAQPQMNSVTTEINTLKAEMDELNALARQLGIISSPEQRASR